MKKGIAFLLGIVLLGSLLMFARSLDNAKLSFENETEYLIHSIPTEPQSSVQETELPESTEAIASVNRVQLLETDANTLSNQPLRVLSRTVEQMTGKQNSSSVGYLGFHGNHMYFTSNYTLNKMDVSKQDIIKRISSMELNDVRSAVRKTYQNIPIKATGMAFFDNKIVLSVCIDRPADSPDLAENGFSSAIVLIDAKKYIPIETKVFTGQTWCSDVTLYKDIVLVGTNDKLLAYKVTNNGLEELQINATASECRGLYVDEASNLLAVSKGQLGVTVYDIKYDGNTSLSLNMKDELLFAQMPECGDANSEGYDTCSPIINDGYVISTLAHTKADGQTTNYKGLIVAPIGTMQTGCMIYDVSTIYQNSNPTAMHLEQDVATGLLCTSMDTEGICLWKWNGDGTVSHAGTVKPEAENTSSLYGMFHEGSLFELNRDLSTDSLTDSISVSRIDMNTAQ